MCIDTTVQRLHYVENGRILDSFSTRTGRPGLETREGTFSVYMKSPKWWSTLYDVWMPYSMFFSGGQAVHFSYEFANSGYGVGSHGCVNLRDMDGIAWMYSKVQVGDRVVVYRS